MKRRWLAMVAAVAVAGGCHAPPSKLPDGEVLRFGVSHMAGSVSFVVRADGTADYTAHQPGSEEEALRGEVPAEELRELAALLRAGDFCTLRSGRDHGVPDEARPSVRVRLDGLDCHVKLWDNEYRDDPDAKRCLAAVEALGRRLRDRSRKH